MTDILKAGSWYRVRLNVFRMFGFEGRGWQPAVWPIRDQENRNVWVATDGEYRFNRSDPIPLGFNQFIDDKNLFKDTRDTRQQGAQDYGNSLKAKPKIENFLFLRTKRFDADRVDSFRFVGVFMPDVDKCIGNVCCWKRVATECTLPDGSWQANG